MAICSPRRVRNGRPFFRTAVYLKRSLRPVRRFLLLSPDVHYGATAAFNNSDMFADVPSAFLPAALVVAVIVVATTCDCSQSLTL